MKPATRTVLVTGATGYIGGRLVPRLLEAGCRVRCLARDPARLQGRPWLGQVEVVAGDCLRAETLPGAMQGVEIAFYLVHSMAGGHDFEDRDVLGGVGMRRGRRDPREVRVGDAVDFWRVEAVEPDRLLRLRAEMKVPGAAWLEFRVDPVDARRSRLSQTAFFAPHGLAGLLYWYLLYPIHAVIFSGMARALARRAEGAAASQRA